ncbi:DUF3263 domain-containing protein [Yimella sp. cx-51]|uniref:DUF3263 domain-containing protein n=1 Tax=Yimella sp. cx-51 TaxID=2770551 RepID=UPI00165E20F1|nr:DUF3263 domain-containing protein [Yimella sp. cx-51]MBC9956247.1 DUF3263 domain-containing protein [Yimella sp. cx-51]MBD2759693.1 DUF3263 domain-containing protein [Yimella sp. cx-573]QTH38607.1 DUF3263 domain-containing protein [Yimella sp. cx-51]
MSAAQEAAAPIGAQLSERDQRILELERDWFRAQGSKEDAIRERLGMSSTAYYQALNALIDNPVALKADPLLVKRLRRLRASRMRQRNARRFGFDN